MNAASAMGVTANLDAGEDVNKMDIITTFLVNIEGERFQQLFDTDGVMQDTEWYAEKAIELIKSCPGGATNCAHLCIDAGTPGFQGKEEKLQTLIQAELPWVTVTLCQMHQGNLYCGDIFKIPEYVGALKKGHAAHLWIKVHHWSYQFYM